MVDRRRAAEVGKYIPDFAPDYSESEKQAEADVWTPTLIGPVILPRIVRGFSSFSHHHLHVAMKFYTQSFTYE